VPHHGAVAADTTIFLTVSVTRPDLLLTRGHTDSVAECAADTSRQHQHRPSTIHKSASAVFGATKQDEVTVMRLATKPATLSASHWLVGNENEDAMTTVATKGRSSVWKIHWVLVWVQQTCVFIQSSINILQLLHEWGL